MNKTFYVILVLSILAIIFVSVYLINRKAPLQPFSNQLGFTQIYTPKPRGRVFTAMYTSGENCESDGIRFNIANEHTLVDRESTWILILNNWLLSLSLVLSLLHYGADLINSGAAIRCIDCKI
jgi:hypothetical protein